MASPGLWTATIKKRKKSNSILEWERQTGELGAAAEDMLYDDRKSAVGPVELLNHLLVKTSELHDDRYGDFFHR